MGERLLCKQEVIGSIPFTSTNAQETKRERICGCIGAWFLNQGCFDL